MLFAAATCVVGLAAVAACGTDSSSDGSTSGSPTSASASEPTCPFPARTHADVDGDGVADVVFAGWAEADDTPAADGQGEHVLGVCASSGHVALHRGAAFEPAGISAARISADGAAYILVEVSNGGTQALRFDGSELQTVMVGADPLEVRNEGTLAGGEGGPLIMRETFGCEDVVGGDGPEVIQIGNWFDISGRLASTLRRVYIVRGAEAQLVINEEKHADREAITELDYPAPCPVD